MSPQDGGPCVNVVTLAIGGYSAVINSCHDYKLWRWRTSEDWIVREGNASKQFALRSALNTKDANPVCNLSI